MPIHTIQQIKFKIFIFLQQIMNMNMDEMK
jgi:hypothetical protein